MRAKTQSDQVPGTKVMRLIMCLVLGTLSLGTYAQDAFYIYRNDGDFNGFFYDEVVEMRQSKIGVDSIEYDKWVTQEVVLEDTIYRIPLAAIDSIGFQQPEIKINPKVKFMERDGYIPYFIEVGSSYSFGPTSSYICLDFTDMPANMVPKVDDVIIGLPTDPIADEKYHRGDLDGSFGCVVDEVEKFQNGNYRVHGRPITEIGQVFEQYITVEQIAVDREGNIHRRIAGCTPDGFPRKVKDAEGDTGDLYLIDFDGTVVKEWDIPGTSAISGKASISADIDVKFKIRASYNITWTRFMVKLTRDLQLRVKPTLGVSASGSFHGTVGDVVPIPSIMFPAAVPVFSTRPYPDVFLKAEGKIEANINLPQVYFGAGEDIIFDSRYLFPIRYGLHLVPDENKDNPTDDMLDLSANLKFSGSIQSGIEFQVSLGTASWFRKVLYGNVGVHLYCGPKMSGEIVFGGSMDPLKGDLDNYDPYQTLHNSQVSASLLAVDLEAGATAGLMWDDPEEETFFSKSWAWLTDTMRLVPGFKSTIVDTTGGKITIHIRPREELFLNATMQIGICKYNSDTYEYTLVKALGDWRLFNFSGYKDDIAYTMTEEDFEGLDSTSYWVLPLVKCGDLGPYFVKEAYTYLHIPAKLEIESDHLEFAGGPEATASVIFTSNYPRDYISFGASQYSWIEPDTLEILDSVPGKYKYKAVFKAKYNTSLFDRQYFKNNMYAPSISVRPAWTDYKHVSLSAHQAGSDLAYVSVNAYGRFQNYTSQIMADNSYINYQGIVTATRTNANTVKLEGSYTQTSGDDNTTYSISCTVQRTAIDSLTGGSIMNCSGQLKRNWSKEGNQYRYSDETILLFGPVNQIYIVVANSPLKVYYPPATTIINQYTLNIWKRLGVNIKTSRQVIPVHSV